MRLISACSNCRSRKKKCLPASSGALCTLCRRKGLSCDLDDVPNQRAAPRISRPNRRMHCRDPSAISVSDLDSSIPSDASSASPSTDRSFTDSPVCDDLIGIYFDMIHNKQQILFQRQQFYADRRAGLIPAYILLGIAALVARFSPDAYFEDTDPIDRAMPLLREALLLFNNRQDLISVQSLQACLLLEFDCFVEGLKDQSSLLVAQAIRMGQILHLQGKPNTDPIRREIEVRLFWAVVMMDIWTSARDQLPRQTWIAGNPHPLDEVIFESMAPGITKLPTAITCEESHRSSIWYQVFNLHESYADILHFIQTTIKHPAIAFQTDLKVQELTARLDRWLRNLPASLLDTPENVQTFIKQGRGRDLSVLHLLYHHQSQLLYFQYLYQSITDSSDAESSPKTTAYATRCKAHAEALSELMWRTNTTRGLECLWSPVNGHLLVVASSVHLYSLLFDDDDFCKPKIRRLLEQNFVMLLQFQKYWPTLTASMSRLQAFHRSCYRGHRESSFKMDEWMLKFLNDYDSPIEDRMPLSFEATGPSKSVEREDANQMALQGLTYNAQSNLRYFLSF